MEDKYCNRKYVEIGETVVIHGAECVCKPINPGLGCNPCILYDANIDECENYRCEPYERPDRKNVVFIKK